MQYLHFDSSRKGPFLTWLNCWKCWVWGTRLTFHMLFLSEWRHTDHLVPSSWRDATGLGCSNFHSILAILPVALPPQTIWALLLETQAKCSPSFLVTHTLEIILTFYLFLICIAQSSLVFSHFCKFDLIICQNTLCFIYTIISKQDSQTCQITHPNQDIPS